MRDNYTKLIEMMLECDDQESLALFAFFLVGYFNSSVNEYIVEEAEYYLKDKP